jgi:uncharacterized repeat protein (TIGR03803 family)
MNTIHWKNDVFATFDTADRWTGDAGPASVPDAIPVEAGDGFGNGPSAATGAEAKSPKLTTLVSFTGADGTNPSASLFADAAGDLFGTTTSGGADNDGNVFEIAKTRHGYASTPTTLVDFDFTDGRYPAGSLIADAAGDLFGTTLYGGADSGGTVFEIARTKHGYASAPTTLVSFDGSDGEYPSGSLIADAAGDLFGTTSAGGGNGDGTVFEIAKTKGGYATTPTTLVSFTGSNGAGPGGSLIADAAGDLFGTTYQGGAHGHGTVFEIAKTQSGYASSPTTLVSFTGADGAEPLASLIADAAGDLFGTTFEGGADNDGTVFEISKTQSGYASAPTTLVSFTGADGAMPAGSLIADAAGDLFGTTEEGGADNDGTVFEIPKTKGGYATTPTTLVSFTNADGANPTGSLIADAAGDFFGTTLSGGVDDEGTVFEIGKTKGGYAFVPPTTPDPHAAHITHASPLTAAFVQAMASFGASRSGDTTPTFLASHNETSMHLSRPQVA